MGDDTRPLKISLTPSSSSGMTLRIKAIAVAATPSGKARRRDSAESPFIANTAALAKVAALQPSRSNPLLRPETTSQDTESGRSWVGKPWAGGDRRRESRPDSDLIIESLEDVAELIPTPLPISALPWNDHSQPTLQPDLEPDWSAAGRRRGGLARVPTSATLETALDSGGVVTRRSRGARPDLSPTTARGREIEALRTEAENGWVEAFDRRRHRAAAGGCGAINSLSPDSPFVLRDGHPNDNTGQASRRLRRHVSRGPQSAGSWSLAAMFSGTPESGASRPGRRHFYKSSQVGATLVFPPSPGPRIVRRAANAAPPEAADYYNALAHVHSTSSVGRVTAATLRARTLTSHAVLTQSLYETRTAAVPASNDE